MPFSDNHKEKYLRKRENLIATFSGCFGNNAKWRRIFETLSAHADKVGKCFVKDIWEAPLRELKIPNNAEYDLVFSSSGFKDGAHSTPYDFKEIAYVCFPAVWKSKRKMRNEQLEPFIHYQYIKQIEAILAAIGGIEMDNTEGELRVYGYRK